MHKSLCHRNRSCSRVMNNLHQSLNYWMKLDFPVAAVLSVSCQTIYHHIDLPPLALQQTSDEVWASLIILLLLHFPPLDQGQNTYYTNKTRGGRSRARTGAVVSLLCHWVLFDQRQSFTFLSKSGGRQRNGLQFVFFLLWGKIRKCSIQPVRLMFIWHSDCFISCKIKSYLLIV